jgi:phosphoglycolate phosphatase-like HAD superfamily hydrolase
VQTCAVTYGVGAREELQACRPDYMIEAFEALLTLLKNTTPSDS